MIWIQFSQVTPIGTVVEDYRSLQSKLCIGVSEVFSL